ncbi:hypothetical protein [Abyssicoccus albus]|uniref:Uncharacterized protein n=1 Tax=Abyssicoccus albus TaxID=1817405 RepID=A0A3N5BHG1_9BACL|nr:hypothetical protein [Abyssicoccus albus]RPF54720.1 hypothetical protein EDD62_1680 [Abyssicoccus albus]
MNVSYDYSQLIDELKSDIDEGLIDPEEVIRVQRGETRLFDHFIVDGIGAYTPYVDYFFSSDDTSEIEVEEIKAKDFLEYMERMNKIM